MLLEERDYRLKPGRVGTFLKAYETLGLPVQRRHLGEPFGFFTSDIGEMNRVIAMWRYADMADRAARREAMLSDPDWPTYLEAIDGLIDTQANRILLPTQFFDLG